MVTLGVLYLLLLGDARGSDDVAQDYAPPLVLGAGLAVRPAPEVQVPGCFAHLEFLSHERD